MHEIHFDPCALRNFGYCISLLPALRMNRWYNIGFTMNFEEKDGGPKSNTELPIGYNNYFTASGECSYCHGPDVSGVPMLMQKEMMSTLPVVGGVA